MNLASVDLNLLVAFEALFAERNVSHAAQRVGLAEPSMSHALTRLYVLAVSELLAVVGHRAAELFAASGALVVYELPITVPSWTVSMLWSRRTDTNPALVWLRCVLHEGLAPLRARGDAS